MAVSGHSFWADDFFSFLFLQKRSGISDAPHEILLVLDGSTGQNAFEQAKQFSAATEINALAITKLDGTAKGGGALAASAVTNAHVKFIGTGEKMNELETFNPEAFISRLLGLGDLEGLLEKVESAVDAKSQKKLKQKLVLKNVVLIKKFS